MKTPTIVETWQCPTCGFVYGSYIVITKGMSHTIRSNGKDIKHPLKRKETK
jgi:hypothetical protein